MKIRILLKSGSQILLNSTEEEYKNLIEKIIVDNEAMIMTNGWLRLTEVEYIQKEEEPAGSTTSDGV